MFARVTPVQGDPSKVEEGKASFENQFLKVARDADGYRGSMLLVDRTSGKGIGMSLWETEENRNQADAILRAARASTLEAMGIDPSTVPEPELYEVVVADLR